MIEKKKKFKKRRVAELTERVKKQEKKEANK